eukprot:gene14416-15955_t
MNIQYFLIILVFIFLININPTVSTGGAIPASEYDALQSLYTSTNGQQWNWGNVSSDSIPWDFTTYNLKAPCGDNWQGVSCSFLAGSWHVEQLYLAFHNLSGPLPAAMGDLTYLTQLVMNDNNITGTFPVAITNLLRLEVIDIHHNNLQGNLPNTMGGLASLTTFVGYFNFFNGTIPSSLYDCSNLMILQLQYNFLAGSISSSIGKLTNLIDLKLISNQLTGPIPSSIGKLTNLTHLEISLNYFQGSLPKEFYNLVKLSILDISQNQLTGRLLPEIGNLTSLQAYSGFENNMFGILPETWYNSTIPIISMSIEGNLFSGPISPALSNWKDTIRTLFLGSNSLTGTISEDLNEIKVLLAFELNHNFFYGTIDSLFLNQHELTYIDWAENSFTGTIPTSMKWNDLLYYLVGQNYMTGTFPTTLANSSKLYYIDCGFNYLHGLLPQYFNEPAKHSLLGYVNFSNNFFTGSMNKTFENVPNLVTLSLSYNLLTGRIPLSIGQM